MSFAERVNKRRFTTLYNESPENVDIIEEYLLDKRNCS